MIRLFTKKYRDTTRVLWVLSAILVSLSGCLFQLTEISKRYFAYGVIKEVDITRPAQVTGPKVIGCADMRDLPLHHLNNSLSGLLQGSPYLNNAMEGWIPSEDGLKECKKEMFVKYDSLCWSCQPSFDKLDVVNPTDSIKDNGIMQITVDGVPSFHTLVKQMRWYVHPMNLSLHGHTSNFLYQDIIFDRKARRCRTCRISMTYVHYETFSLEAPYRTDCMVYSEHGCESRAHCIELCERSMIPTDYLIPGHLGTGNMSVLVGDSENKNISIDKALKQKVMDKCAAKYSKLDCHMEYYTPKWVVFRKTNQPYTTMNLLTSPEPTVTAFTLGSIELIDFIVYILSVVSFWLGFCPLTCLLDDRVTGLMSAKTKASADGYAFRKSDQLRFKDIEEEIAQHRLSLLRIDEMLKRNATQIRMCD